MAATAQDPSAPLRSADKMKDDERDEDTEYSPFYGIEKGAVLQEARIFNDAQVDARRCQQVITKLLYLLCQGESFTKKEATDVFFSVTKLFQAKDSNLRRMVYLIIKEVCPGSDEVIIITSSLMKDMTSKIDLYRSNAIRVLCSIADSQVLGNIERYFKQAVVDRSEPVASAVLVSAMHLLKDNTEIVKRWTSEIQEVVQSKSGMVQFHALSLLHALRAKDRLAVSKLVSSMTRAKVFHPMAGMMLVRYVAQVIQESGPSSGTGTRPFYDYLEGCLRNKSDIVMFEAAKAICNMPDVTTREITPAISVLQLFLSSSKPHLRFAAVRYLNKVAVTHALVIAGCNLDLEGLIQDSNRSIATLAITTLLKTGSEGGVDRLLKQIGAFMSDIADEFKIVVVEAIRTLCLKFPQKYRSLMNFLSSVLREDGGFEYKKVIVDSILILIREIPEAKEPGLNHLCEFIEDCEFTYLSTQILHLLGQEGPATQEPAKYIRYIYNRVILENATVRAAAVTCLAKFAAHVEELRPRIVVLLKRALYDNDDEVRDRATLHLAELTDQGKDIMTDLTSTWTIPANHLVTSLNTYLANGDFSKPFDLATVPKAAPKKPEHDPKRQQATATTTQNGFKAGSQYAEALSEVPELASLGPPQKSAEPYSLTEEDTEYNVTLIKHIFESHVLLQFDCTNTVQEQILENVSVEISLGESEDLVEELNIPLSTMEYNTVGHTFVLLSRVDGALAMADVMATLKFTVKEIDPSSGEAEEEGYEDEYQLEDFEISGSDYISAERVGNFKQAWEEMDPESEQVGEYALGQRGSLQATVEAIASSVGMAACEGTDAVPPNARSHTLLLTGAIVGGSQVAVRVNLGIDAKREVAMKLSVRSSDLATSEIIHEIFTG